MYVRTHIYVGDNNEKSLLTNEYHCKMLLLTIHYKQLNMETYTLYTHFHKTLIHRMQDFHMVLFSSIIKNSNFINYKWHTFILHKHFHMV
jgi:hypothetical protein